jgi:N4-(beta-N-acetylglucosaminyl)-L-asparaginase
MSFSRRDFLATSTLGTIGIGLEAQSTNKEDAKAAQTRTEAIPNRGKNVIITKRTGINSLDAAYRELLNGADTLDVAIKVGKDREDDPNDDTVGLGGLPNEDGVVELDSSCMHGPTRRAGAVGGVRGIKNVSLLAKAVMEHTGHVTLVAEGAEKFAKALGFPQENLLTEDARKTWLLWKENMSDQDWWGPSLADPKYQVPPGTQAPPKMSELYEERWRHLEESAAALGIAPERRAHAIDRVLRPPTGTIHCSVLNAKGEVSGMTTTSGLAWKLAGRLGDSPIIGAGCYTDPDIGSAGATGSGEENIKVVGAHSIIENMRKGMSPREAGLDVLKRIAHSYQSAPAKIRFISMVYYILRKDGEYAGVSMWSGPKDQPMTFAVCDGNGKARLEPCVPLFQGEPLDFPPAPQGKWFR